MDWKRLLLELKDAGHSQQSIAEHCGARQSTVSDIATGKTKEPKYLMGVKLVALHASATKRRRTTEKAGA